MMYAKMKSQGLVREVDGAEDTDSDEERLSHEMHALGDTESRDSDDNGKDEESNDRKGLFKPILKSRKIKAMDKDYKDTVAMAGKKRSKFIGGDSKDIGKQNRRAKPRGIPPIAPGQALRMADLSKTLKRDPEVIAKEKREQARQLARNSPVINKYKYKDESLDIWKYASSALGHMPLPSIVQLAPSEDVNPWNQRACGGQDGASSGGDEQSTDTADTYSRGQKLLTRTMIKDVLWEENFLENLHARRLSLIYDKYDNKADENLKNFEADLDRTLEWQREIQESRDAHQAAKKTEAKFRRRVHRTMQASTEQRIKERKKALLDQLRNHYTGQRKVDTEAVIAGAASTTSTRKIIDFMLTGGELDTSFIDNMHEISDTESLESYEVEKKRLKSAPISSYNHKENTEDVHFGI